MIKRIIVEGADQQGKTSLCKELSEKLGWNIVHFGKPSKDFDFLKGYMVPENTISDRNFLSEVVYSKVNGYKSRTSITLQSNVFKYNDTLLILLDRGEYFEFDSERHEEYSLPDILKSKVIYNYEFGKLNMEKMRINPNSQEYKSKVQSIVDLINGNLQET